MGLQKISDNQNGGIVVPAALWFMGVPFIIVLLLWAFVFRG